MQILLPASARKDLMDQDTMRNGAMLFEIKAGDRRTHAGVLDFSAVEGTVGLPSHTARNVFGDSAIPSGQRVTVTYRKLSKGTPSLPRGRCPCTMVLPCPPSPRGP